jgi:hypothetical protein
MTHLALHLGGVGRVPDLVCPHRHRSTAVQAALQKGRVVGPDGAKVVFAALRTERKRVLQLEGRIGRDDFGYICPRTLKEPICQVDLYSSAFAERYRGCCD